MGRDMMPLMREPALLDQLCDLIAARARMLTPKVVVGSVPSSF